MGEKLVVGPFTKGLRDDVTAFNIDNDSFPNLQNAYQWRGRVKRKRGTELLTRLRRYFDSQELFYNPGGTTTITLDGSGTGNILTGFTGSGLEATAQLIPTLVSISNGGKTYIDPDGDGSLEDATVPGVSVGSVNYTTGDITILALAGLPIAVSFWYHPGLPVMGLEPSTLDPTDYSRLLAFDTVYSYFIPSFSPYQAYPINFYKNPATATYAGYTQKTDWTSFLWTGENYQQFYSCNFRGATWVCNGMRTPFDPTKTGMQFLAASEITSATQTSATTVDFVIPTTSLVIGDFVFANEFGGASASTLNFQTGFVTAIVPATNTYTITFPNATVGAAGLTPGILQLLTSTNDTTRDGIRFYDGNPVNGATPPVFSTTGGWVNFAPPLSNLSFAVGGKTPRQYYLVGARMMIPFKERLLFIGPVIQASSGNPIYLTDTIVYSQVGTPYYTASFSGAPSSTTTYNPILVPSNQTAQPTAWWEDQRGLGGWTATGFNQTIYTVSQNEDVLLIGMESHQLKLCYTNDDLLPFVFYDIDSNLGSDCTFSTIQLDRGALTLGPRSFVMTTQTEAKRFDLEIPSAAFIVQNVSNGSERVTAIRDYDNEWAYFTCCYGPSDCVFPSITYFYNYRDLTWATFKESYTTYGPFSRLTGDTWATIGDKYSSWSAWNTPWRNASLLSPEIVGGNGQGFVLNRSTNGTSEATSLFISDITGNTVTSPNHCLEEEDYVIISDCLGSIGAEVNGNVYQINVTGANTFTIDAATIPTGAYIGGGLITRLYKPFVQTKQFPAGWEMDRKTRLGKQSYLLSKTAKGQITLQIYLSQNGSSPYNESNDAVDYSTVLYTCPESTNLGLTPSNVNLQMPTAIQQEQIWHRMNTSLIGDTIQIGFTLSDSQMRSEESNDEEIELHGFILDISPSQLLV